MDADLVRELRQFVDDRDWSRFHAPKNLAMALSVEVAELLEHFQWMTLEDSDHLSEQMRRRVREEIGDVVIYLSLLCDRLGLDPVAAARDKLESVKQKYPADAVRGKSLKSTEYR